MLILGKKESIINNLKKNTVNKIQVDTIQKDIVFNVNGQTMETPFKSSISHEDYKSNIYIGGFPPGMHLNLPEMKQFGFFKGCLDLVRINTIII